MLQISSISLKKHYDALRKEVFFVDDKWPQFNILFDDIIALSKKFKKNKNVLSLERGGLYGNISIFAPFFKSSNFLSIDCSEREIKKRGAYNKKFTINKNIIKIPINKQSDYKNLKLKKNSIDLIIIPNLMHHIYDHKYLLKKCSRFLKKNGFIYIFEPILREIHQKPCDYFRFTPDGMNKILKDLGFKKLKTKLSGGPFSATAYCWDQALQYLPLKDRKKYKRFLISNNMKFITNLDTKFKKNYFRKNTLFPVSFSILGKNGT